MTHSEFDNLNQQAKDQTTSSVPTSVFQPGQALGGRYQVIDLLGKGGMGLVYRVNQIFLNKQFALKTIDKHSVSNIAIRRFQQEAKTAFALSHPSIITVNDFGVLDDQTPFLVMEIIKGETLGDYLKRNGVLTVDQAIPIFVQICFGLAYAHEHGVVHRDIKPNNIMLVDELKLGTEGSVKIVDFGIAKLIEHEGGEIQALTRTGEIFGSPLYMSPEQCSGARVDHRSDIYSLGCVFFEALTGAPPCVGENALVTMMKHQSEAPLTLKQASLGLEFPKAIEAIVSTMLAKSPEKRYQNLGIVAHDLGALRRGEVISGTVKASASNLVEKSKTKTISMSTDRFYALLVAVSLSSLLLTLTATNFFRKNQNQIPQLATHAAATHTAETAVFNEPPELSMPPLDQETTKVFSDEELKKNLARREFKNKLALKYCKLTEHSLSLIAATSDIDSLALRACAFDSGSLMKLTKLNLLRFDVTESKLDDADVEAVCKFPVVRDINVTHTNLSNEQICKFAGIKTLEHLSVGETALDNSGLSTLSKLPKLDLLDLHGDKQITNIGLQALEPVKLTWLGLAASQIDDGGMKYLSKMPKLRSVLLNDTKVSIRGITILCKKSAVREVGLARCPNITATDIIQLKKQFPSVDFKDSNEPKHVAREVIEGFTSFPLK